MRWANATGLWLLLIVPAVMAALSVAIARRRHALARFCGPTLARRLTRAASTEVLLFKASLFSIGVLCVVVALARPQWGSTLEPIARKGVDVLIGIDISESMLAEDVRPSRLGKARGEALRLLERLEGNRVGLLAWAGAGGVLCPLTLDTSAVRMFLDALEPDMISHPGTSLAEALRAGVEAYGREERQYKVMVLFTDGEEQVDRDEAVKAARVAAGEGVIIHTIGVGTAAGAPIPQRSADGAIASYRKDNGGRIVTTRLDEALLADLSAEAGGRYWPATIAEEEVDRVVEAIGSMDRKEVQARLMTQFEERFQIPLAGGLLALLIDAFVTGRRRPRGPEREVA